MAHAAIYGGNIFYPRGSLRPEKIPVLLESLEFDRMAVRVLDEHASLFAYFPLHHHGGLDVEGPAHLLQFVAHLTPVTEREHDAPMIARDLTLRVVDAGGLDQLRYLLNGELVPEEIIIHPCLGTAPFTATEKAAIKGLEALEIGGGEGEVEAALQWHVVVVWMQINGAPRSVQPMLGSVFQPGCAMIGKENAGVITGVQVVWA